MKPLLILTLFLVFFIFPVQAFSIGTAPGVHYLGEFDPGDAEYIKFYLLTNANGDVLTTLSFTSPHLELYFPGNFKYISSYETSQEDISDWIIFQQNPVLVSPRKSFIVTLEGGEIVKANAEAVYKLNIPKDAEPGYHIGSVSLSPKVMGEGAGTGIATIGLTRYLFVFKVKGKAERSGEIKNIYADRVAGNRARIDIIFQNTGKDTVSVWVEELNIYNEYGNITSNLKSGIKYVSPGETQILPVYWMGEGVTGGTYNAEAKISYLTGYSSKAATIEIPDIISIPTEVSKFEFPWWILLLIVLIIILVIYWKS